MVLQAGNEAQAETLAFEATDRTGLMRGPDEINGDLKKKACAWRAEGVPGIFKSDTLCMSSMTLTVSINK